MSVTTAESRQSGADSRSERGAPSLTLGDERFQSVLWDTRAGQVFLRSPRHHFPRQGRDDGLDELAAFSELDPEARDLLIDRARAARDSGSDLNSQLWVTREGQRRLIWLHLERAPREDDDAPLRGGAIDVTELAASILSQSPPSAGPAEPSAPGRFTWNSVTRVVQLSQRASDLLGLDGPGAFPEESLREALTPDSATELINAVQTAENGKILDVIVSPTRVPERRLHLRLRLSAGTLDSYSVTGTVQDVGDEAALGDALLNLSRSLTVLSYSTDVLNTARTRQQLLDEVCATIVREGGYRFAWYGEAVHDPERTVRPVAWAGHEDGYLTLVPFHWDEDVQTGQGPTGTAIRTGEAQLSHLLAADVAVSPWRGPAVDRGYVSSIALPVYLDGAVDGALMVYASEPTAFDPTEISLLSDLARDIGFGMRRIVDTDALVESERRYRLLAENTSDVVYLLDRDMRFSWLSASVESVTGYNSDELIGRRHLDLVHADDAATVAATFAERYGATVGTRFRFRVASGDYRWMSANGRWATDEQGGVLGLVVGIRDIHEQVATESALAEREARYRLLADNASDVVLQIGSDGRISWASESLSSVLGWDGREVLGKVATELVHLDDRSEAAEGLLDVLDGETIRGQVRALTRTGASRWMSVTVHRIATPDSVFRVVAMRDIDDAVAARRDLEHARDHDPLTGLATRPSMHQSLNQMLMVSPPDRLVAVLYVGIDGLKDVNDALTHAAGDLVLTTIAARLSAVVAETDQVGRAGGDEFLVLIPDLTHAHAAVALAERLRLAAHGTVQVGPHRLQQTVSIGIAVGGLDAEAEDLLRDASLAMQRAKADGRDRVSIADGGAATEARRRLDVDRALRDGLARGELQPWFMPIVRLSDGVLCGYEALVRWIRPDGATVEPMAFLPIAERTPIITELDLVVLEASLRRLHELPDGVSMSVNVAARSLSDPDYADRVRQLLQEYDVADGRLHLEVTETATLRIDAHVRAVMAELDAAGVRWFMDDFGTGYSSISHLRELPIRGMKLDRSFTTALGAGEEKARRLAQALGGLAVGLGLDTVAEGVETEEQARVLASYGWVHGQGWLYGKAAPLP